MVVLLGSRLSTIWFRKFGIFKALAEFERELIAERTHFGLAAARARGRQGEHPRKMDRATVMMAIAAMTYPKANAIEVARRWNITTTTLYAYVNGDATLKQTGGENLDQGITGLATNGKISHLRNFLKSGRLV